jgi:hypothetical protein
MHLLCTTRSRVLTVVLLKSQVSWDMIQCCCTCKSRSYTGSSSPQMFDPEDEGTVIPSKIRNFFLSNTASHPSRLETSTWFVLINTVTWSFRFLHGSWLWIQLCLVVALSKRVTDSQCSEGSVVGPRTTGINNPAMKQCILSNAAYLICCGNF